MAQQIGTREEQGEKAFSDDRWTCGQMSRCDGQERIEFVHWIKFFCFCFCGIPTLQCEKKSEENQLLLKQVLEVQETQLQMNRVILQTIRVTLECERALIDCTGIPYIEDHERVPIAIFRSSIWWGDRSDHFPTVLLKVIPAVKNSDATNWTPCSAAHCWFNRL